MITIRDYYREIIRELTSVLGSLSEAEAAARIIFEDVADYSRAFIYANGDREISEFMQRKIRDVVDKILSGEPVQYAVGKARFMAYDFIVTPDVLIPRPETEGLVDIISDDWSGCRDLDILDIGTGSGCIAISLARVLPFSRVSAFDISDKAIAVARKNAEILKADVVFEQCDILNTAPSGIIYDIIVSNPPYIADSESSDMDARVLNNEPHTALFVPDSDPLVFYRAIASFARQSLKQGGRLYLEINRRFPDEMANLLRGEGFDRVAVLRDFRGNYRYATATQP